MTENKITTNADAIKTMSVDALAAFLTKCAERHGYLLEKADSYICCKCKKENGGKCPVNMDTEPCLYDMGDLQTIKYWLEGEIERN